MAFRLESFRSNPCGHAIRSVRNQPDTILPQTRFAPTHLSGRCGESYKCAPMRPTGRMRRNHLRNVWRIPIWRQVHLIRIKSSIQQQVFSRSNLRRSAWCNCSYPNHANQTATKTATETVHLFHRPLPYRDFETNMSIRNPAKLWRHRDDWIQRSWHIAIRHTAAQCSSRRFIY